MQDLGTSLLDEHQAPDKGTGERDKAVYNPTDEESKTIKLVNELFEKAKKHRRQYDEHWMDYYKMFRGRQWKEQRPSYRHSEVINMIFQNIQGLVPLMMDAKPKIDFIPREPQDFELAQILSEVADADWEKNNWLMQLTEIVYDGHFYGTGFAGVEFDPKANLGLGEITFESADPFYVFPDPSARDVNKKGKFFIYAEPVDLEILKKEYPEHAKHLKADLLDLIQGEKTALDKVRYRSPVDSKTLLESESPNSYDLTGKNQALKITCYLHDDTYTEERLDKLKEDGTPDAPVYEQKLKYPNGRKICVAGGVLVHDGPNPYEDNKFPYARFVNYILPREFWGMSEVEQLQSPQRIFNKLVSFALDVLTLMGNPIWVVDNDSGIDTDNLVNRPGLIVEKNKGTEARREEGVQLQPYVMNLIDRMKTWFDDISGNNDVSRGVRPEGVTAAAAINSLQEAAKTRVRQKSRNLDCLLQDVGQLWLSRAMQFYTAPQVYRYTNNQNVTKYFKFHVDQVEDPETQEPQKVARVSQYQMDDQGNVTLGEPKSLPVTGNFDVKVSTGSSLPFAKADKINMAFKAFEAQAIDAPELLKEIDWPNWQAVVERVEARKAQAAQAQMQADMAAKGMPQQGAPGQAPPPAA